MPTIRAVNPRAWITKTDYPELEFPPSLRTFTAQRAELLTVLNGLAPGDWSRTARVTGAGSPLTKTVLDYAWRMAVHERPHIAQIARMVTT
jgi:hypothetical protein